MAMAKRDQRKYCFNSTAKSAMKELKSSFLSIFWWQTRDDRNNKRPESSEFLRKGHFSVIVLKNGEPKKFSVALTYLRYPLFIKLLDAAEQEYGFNQKGALIIPCEAGELERILSEIF